MAVNPSFLSLIRRHVPTIACFLCIGLHTNAQQRQQSSIDSAIIFLKDSTLYTKVDTLASFPGGNNAWQSFLLKNLRYPAEAMDNDIMGETYTSFIVDVDGSVSDIKAVHGHPILAKESKRIIKLSGKWEPAVYQGEKIKTYHIQPITYKLEKDRGGRRKKNR